MPGRVWNGSFSCLIPDEDGSEFERELVEALEGLGVSATAEKLSKVAGYRILTREIYFGVFTFTLLFCETVFFSNRPVKAPAARSLI